MHWTTIHLLWKEEDNPLGVLCKGRRQMKHERCNGSSITNNMLQFPTQIMIKKWKMKLFSRVSKSKKKKSRKSCQFAWFSSSKDWLVLTSFVAFWTKNLWKFYFSSVDWTNFANFLQKIAKFLISQIEKKNPFIQVVRNVKGGLKICALYLDYSHIFLPYIWDKLLTEWVNKVKLDINWVEIHPQGPAF